MHPGPKRLLVRVVEYNAEYYPTRIYATFPRNGELENGFQDLNFRDLANAVNRAAWWLDSLLGPKNEGFETFAYIGAKDIRYAILALAAIKTGRKASFDFFYILLTMMLKVISRFYFPPHLAPPGLFYLFSKTPSVTRFSARHRYLLFL